MNLAAFGRHLFIGAVTFSLLGTLTLTALASVNRPDDQSIVLSSAVLVVAFAHYHNIRIETTQLGSGSSPAQREAIVDGLRHSDWLITLPTIVYELHLLAEQSPAYSSPLFGKEIASALTAAMIALGAVWRFGCNELLDTGKKRTTLIGAFSLLIAFVICLLLMINLLYRTTATHPHYLAITVFVTPWPFYGMVAILQAGALQIVEHNFVEEYDERISIAKDVAYGILDVICKCGLGLYVFFLQGA